MPNTLEVVIALEKAKLEQGGAALRSLLEQVIAKAAFDVQAGAQERVPVKTGATKSSIYVSIAGRSSTYSQGVGEAQTRRPGVMVSSEEAPEGEAGLAARIGPSTSYAPLLEFGTHSRPARPYMVPSLERVRPGFEAAIKQAFEKAFGESTGQSG